MISKIALNIADSFVSKNIIREEMRDVCIYGLDLMISGIINVAVVLITGALIGKFLLAIVFMAILIPLRMFTGGYHADTHIGCNVVCIVTFILSILLLGLIQKHTLETVTWGLLCVCIIIIAKFSPIENPNKKVTSEQKIRYKHISVSMCSVLSVVSIIMNIISCSKDEQNLLKLQMLSLYINITLIIIAGTMVLGRWKEGRGKCQTS